MLLFLVIVAAIFYARPPVLASFRHLAFDAYQRLSTAPPAPDAPVRVVHIDEASLRELGQWPWSRTVMAELTDRLGQAGAAAIAFDVLFAEPDRTSPEVLIETAPAARREAVRQALGGVESHDALFAAALGRHPSVLAASLHDQPSPTPFPMRAGLAVAGDDPAPFLLNFPGAATSLPVLSDAARGVGFINWLPDNDQIVRRVPLLLRHDAEITPALSLEALRVALGASTYIVRAANASGATALGANTGVNGLKVGPLEIPTDAEGQIWLRFRPYDPSQAIPAWRVLRGEVPPETFAGTIVLIGASAPGLMDLRATPLDASIPGVELHRQVIEQVLAGRFLTRPDYAPGAELLAALLAVLLLALAAPRLGPATNAVIALVAVAAVWITSYLMFERMGELFDPVFPTLAALLFGASATTYFYQRSEQQRVGIRRAFSHYVAPSVVRQLTANPERLKLGGEVRDLTILVCDIRNFSSIAERMSAVELTTFINKFLTPLSNIVIENGGTIDKYMGDALLAFWNAPIDQPDHAQRACRAAVQIVARMTDLNRTWRREAAAAGRAFEDIRIGIGVNSGECCVGNLGSERRFDYSAIGDAVNIASRLEGLSKMYGLELLVSEDTCRGVSGIAFVEVDMVRLKGRAGATRVFTVLPAKQRAPANHAAFLEAFRQGRMAEASAMLNRAETPAFAGLYANFAERLAAAGDPPPADWDGVYDPEGK